MCWPFRRGASQADVDELKKALAQANARLQELERRMDLQEAVAKGTTAKGKLQAAAARVAALPTGAPDLTPIGDLFDQMGALADTIAPTKPTDTGDTGATDNTTSGA